MKVGFAVKEGSVGVRQRPGVVLVGRHVSGVKTFDETYIWFPSYKVGLEYPP